MRCVIIVKATPASEAGILPKAELFEAMGRHHEQLVSAAKGLKTFEQMKAR
jgi:hypothetical protein